MSIIKLTCVSKFINRKRVEKAKGILSNNFDR